MNMQLTRWIAVTLLSSAMAACGGGGDVTDGTGSGSGSGGGGGTGTTITPIIRLGILDAGEFEPGVLDIGTTTLSAGGTTGVRVDIIDTANSNAFVTSPVTVTFSSTCISQSRAEMDAVTTSTGSLNASYTAKGCSGTDTITATAVVGGNTITASGDIEVSPDSLGSLAFVSATPPSISPLGLGNEISTVRFRVLGAGGGPVADQTVTFALTTTTGGITLSPATAVTDNDGFVNTIVTAGTVSTVVRVRATAIQETTPGVFVTKISESNLLTIATSIADQDSFTIAAETLNPLALNCVGTESEISVFLADRFSNPVADGTAVSFRAEGGRIEPSCTTVKGSCSVTWNSQLPIPESYCTGAGGCVTEVELIDDGDDMMLGTSDDVLVTANNANGPRRGRATILATAFGEESFVDKNGNGVFDSDDLFDVDFDDLDEAFLDVNEDGTFNSEDVLIDFGGGDEGAPNGVFDAGGNTYTGQSCQEDDPDVPLICDSATNVHVRGSLTLSMSGSSPAFDSSRDVITEAPYDDTTGTFEVPVKGVIAVGFVLRDVNFQPMPSETTITAATGSGGATVSSGASRTVANTNNDSRGANTYVVFLKGSDTPSSTTLDLTVTTPVSGACGQLATTISFIVDTVAVP